jgi:hypothetical protein
MTKLSIDMDKFLHNISLDICEAFKHYYNNNEPQIAEELLTAYRNIRRHIAKDANGYRYGSKEAHKAMQS